MTDIFYSVSDSTTADSGDTGRVFLLYQLPSSLWEKSSTDIGKIHSVPPMKIQNLFL